eukprot:TRINITY_DN5195_c0_g1_i1.p1 TRINITY_DN5195_c0_g1~~TRINITY_DN5195_c0_g1_i1.p1  ORF type:complete len:127 (-),score=7.30 TRINITY_DN5195_c0_g1_i1:416-796(-)
MPPTYYSGGSGMLPGMSGELSRRSSLHSNGSLRNISAPWGNMAMAPPPPAPAAVPAPYFTDFWPREAPATSGAAPFYSAMQTYTAVPTPYGPAYGAWSPATYSYTPTLPPLISTSYLPSEWMSVPQ